MMANLTNSSVGVDPSVQTPAPVQILSNNTGPVYTGSDVIGGHVTGSDYKGGHMTGSDVIVSDVIANGSTVGYPTSKVNVEKMLLWFLVTGVIIAIVLFLWCIYLIIQYKTKIVYNWHYFWGQSNPGGQRFFEVNRRLAKLSKKRKEKQMEKKKDNEKDNQTACEEGMKEDDCGEGDDEDDEDRIEGVEASTSTHILLNKMCHESKRI